MHMSKIIYTIIIFNHVTLKWVFQHITVDLPETKKSRGDFDPLAIKINRKNIIKVRDTGYSSFIDCFGWSKKNTCPLSV